MPSQCQLEYMQRLLLQVKANGEQVAPVKIYEVVTWFNKIVCSNTIFCCFCTCVSAVGLVSLIYTIKNPITAVRVGPTASFITLKGVVTTVVGWRNRVVLNAVPLIGL